MQLSPLATLFGGATFAAVQAANVTTGKLGDARPVRNNPVIGETWVATFDSTAVKGAVTAVAHTVGVNYTINVTGLAVEKGPYKYHIHVNPVPESGSCTETGGHLDSYVRGAEPPCDSSMPQTCEVGDLSGKYGAVAGPDVKKEFNDPYTAMNTIQLGYVANRSIVFHDESSARIACATLKKVESADTCQG
ncbi:Cu,Zn superoxide dismutase-like protein [Parathielavia appendiculata]|uniref:superoxide dismutase n=1 Tax=Parathielavia appendiculata TaxID=2587402 RepID=A0AAN6Z8Q0_9PEZI|nr:Cu,Zn superoxide dismutase-like protein [Parathielavia appendiculata]